MGHPFAPADHREPGRPKTTVFGRGPGRWAGCNVSPDEKGRCGADGGPGSSSDSVVRKRARVTQTASTQKATSIRGESDSVRAAVGVFRRVTAHTQAAPKTPPEAPTITSSTEATRPGTT